jgi:hypothetical protein
MRRRKKIKSFVRMKTNIGILEIGERLDGEQFCGERNHELS